MADFSGSTSVAPTWRIACWLNIRDIFVYFYGDTCDYVVVMPTLVKVLGGQPCRTACLALEVAMIQEKREEDPLRLASGLRSLTAPSRPSRPLSARISDETRLIDPVDSRSRATAHSGLVRNARVSIGVVDQHSFTRDCISRSLKDFDDDLEVTSFTSAEDCLQSLGVLDVILYHTHETFQHGNDRRLAPVRKLLKLAPLIILSAADNAESLIEAFESGARGYIPTLSTPAELVVEIIRLVKAGGTFVPPSGLRLQRMTRKGLPTSTARGQQFTARQIAVLNLLTHGKTNKIIAYELAISESTVKVHVRNIMKKMNASNRTEAACRARACADTVYPDVISNGGDH
jgi:DNA-binding NarL/FixJ family response regulator